MEKKKFPKGIAPCRGLGCKIRQNCLRYHKFIDEETYSFFFISPFERDKCEHFIEWPTQKKLQKTKVHIIIK